MGMLLSLVSEGSRTLMCTTLRMGMPLSLVSEGSWILMYTTLRTWVFFSKKQIQELFLCKWSFILYFVFPVFWFWVPKMFPSIDRFSISFQPFFISMDFYDYVYVIQFLIYSINHLLKIFYHWPIQLLSSVGAIHNFHMKMWHNPLTMRYNIGISTYVCWFD
jgi:hypothetical protein